MEGWENVYISQFEHKIGIVKAVLKDHGIDSVVVNKKDSFYLVGELELYVNHEDVLRAKNIIIKEEL